MQKATRFDDAKYEVKPQPLDAEEYQRERDIPFYFDPGHDYAKDVDFLVPPYVLPEYETHEGRPGAAFSEVSGTRDVRVGPRAADTRVMSYIRYDRAGDLAGNVCQLSVSTCRPGIDRKNPAKKMGYDGIGTETRVRAEKSRAGWLFLEPGVTMYGRSGQEYLAWALAVLEKRQIAHSEWERIEAQATMDRYKRKSLELQAEAIAAQKSNSDDLAAKVATAVAAAMPQIIAAIKGSEAPARKSRAAEAE